MVIGPMPELSECPWTPDEVASLNAYQQSGYMHPFTGERHGSGVETVLIATAAGWVEREGGPVVQRWAHRFMTDWSWQAKRQMSKARNEVPGFIHCAYGPICVGATAVCVQSSVAYPEGDTVLLIVYQGFGEVEVAVLPAEARRLAALLLEKATEMERTTYK